MALQGGLYLNSKIYSMSGHSKWHSIRHKKGAADAKRGKIFTRHAKLITVAAQQGGGDPEMNPGLRLAIEKAKAENMPNDNIARAVKKGTGELKDGAVIMEVNYEGYGPNGIAIMISCLTDNKNRTVASLRSILSKNGGSMGESGCVGWMFHKKGVLTVDLEGKDAEELELLVIDAGAEDVKVEGSSLEVITAPDDFEKVKKGLEGNGVEFLSADVTLLPENTIAVDNEDDAKRILRLIDLIEEDDDVNEVYSNFDIPSEVLERLM